MDQRRQDEEMMNDAPSDGGFFPIVYDELRRLAAARLSDEAAGHSLDANSPDAKRPS